MGDPGNTQPPPAPADASLQPRSFKLRFAPSREPGRSDVSLVKPLGLPSTVTDKFYSGRRQEGAGEALEEAALRRLRDLFQRGPRDKYPAPVTSAHEYGWHWSCATRVLDRRVQHGVRDSAWLRERARLLHADALLKQR